jgi:hypothetical protein
VPARTRETRSLCPVRRRALLLAALCGAGVWSCGGGDGAAGPGGIVTANWTDDASEYRGRNGSQFQYRCPAGGTASAVWGTDVYTDDSSVCTAAVHAGRITFAQGGVVTFEIRPGQSSYAASTRNGVASGPWDQWVGSFRFP